MSRAQTGGMPLKGDAKGGVESAGDSLELPVRRDPKDPRLILEARVEHVQVGQVKVVVVKGDGGGRDVTPGCPQTKWKRRSGNVDETRDVAADRHPVHLAVMGLPHV